MGQASSARSDLRDCGLSALKVLLRTGDRIPETYGERSCQEIQQRKHYEAAQGWAGV